MGLAVVVAAWILLDDLAVAATWVVLPDGTGDAPTIQAAVDSAAAGDEVVLANGTFGGEGNVDIDYRGKAVTVRSLSGDPSLCIIDCTPWGECWGDTGFLFRTGEGASSLLEGVEIRYAWGGIYYGSNCAGAFGAIVCEGTSPTIRNVVVTQSQSGIHVSGGGSPRFENVRVVGSYVPAFVSHNSAPTITGCVVSANTRPGTGFFGGAGLSLYASNATIENCRIEGNVDVGVNVWSSSPLLRGCVIVGNDVGGLFLDNSSFPTLEACTVTRNHSGGLGGGIRLRGGSSLTLERTIVWGNCAAGGAAELYVDVGCTVNAVCSDVRQSGVGGAGMFNAGLDVIDLPPNFCDPLACADAPSVGGDYTVDDDSPVVTAPCGFIGALAANCTIHVESVSWGAIKALYR